LCLLALQNARRPPPLLQRPSAPVTGRRVGKLATGRYTRGQLKLSGTFIMKRFLLPFIGLVVLTAALAGCGQKGPLYLPSDQETVEERKKDRFEL
jgi:predicted small lipoprotein YifL